MELELAHEAVRPTGGGHAASITTRNAVVSY
jgi:hypothetical protein